MCGHFYAQIFLLNFSQVLTEMRPVHHEIINQNLLHVIQRHICSYCISHEWILITPGIHHFTPKSIIMILNENLHIKTGIKISCKSCLIFVLLNNILTILYRLLIEKPFIIHLKLKKNLLNSNTGAPVKDFDLFMHHNGCPTKTDSPPCPSTCPHPIFFCI